MTPGDTELARSGGVAHVLVDRDGRVVGTAAGAGWGGHPLVDVEPGVDYRERCRAQAPALGQALEGALEGASDRVDYALAVSGRAGRFRATVQPLVATGDPAAIVSHQAEDGAPGRAARDEAAADLAEVTANLPGAVFQFQLSPSGERSFRLVQGRVDELLGVSLDEVLDDAAAIFDRVPPDHLGRVLEAIATSARTQGVFSEELPFLRPDGRTVWIKVDSDPRLLPDGTIRWAGLALDISARKEAELALQEAKEAAEAAYRSKSQFLASVSHELRTPLNAVVGLSSLLLETREPLAPEALSYAQTIRSSADMLAALIEDLLDLASAEAGKLQLARRPFDLDDCVETSLALLATRAGAKGIELAYAVEGGEGPVRLIGDAGRLRQVLVNLIGNAVKFSDRGDVLVTAALADAAPGRRRVRLAVHDEGVGIDPGRVEELFEAYAQGDPFGDRKAGGAGLGLTISKAFVDAMGGRLSAEPRAEGGSVFWLEVELEEAPGDPSPWAAAVAGRPVLLSVSNAHTRLMIRRQLLSVGALPAPAEPAGALEAVRGGEPFAAALVADDQPDLVQALEERRIPWVALRPAGSRGAGSGSSPAGFLIRPVRREQLRALLERLLATVGTPPPARPPRKGARVLVVEDNPVNQTVAREMLGRLGYRVAVVSSGRDALEALEAVPYDVVLMDVQMPHLDGLQTTRAIRQRWPDGGPHVIAVTASATEQDRARCLAAGMDGYLTKPLRPESLQEQLDGAGAAPTNQSPAGGGVSEPTDLAVDLEPLEALGVPDLIPELIGLFLEDSPAIVEAIAQAAEDEDPVRFRGAVHQLKGSASGLHAGPLAAICAEAERLTRAGKFTTARTKLPEIQAEFERVRRELVAYADGHPAG